MKNIFKILFTSRKYNVLKEPIKQLKEQKKQPKKECSHLIFSFYFNNIDFFRISYQIFQTKRHGQTIKCLAKIQQESKQILKNKKIDFLKDVIIFPLNQLNKVNCIYNIGENQYSLKHLYQVRYDHMPCGCVIATLDEECCHQDIKELFNQKRKEKIQIYQNCFQ